MRERGDALCLRDWDRNKEKRRERKREREREKERETYLNLFNLIVWDPSVFRSLMFKEFFLGGVDLLLHETQKLLAQLLQFCREVLHVSCH